MAEQNDPVNSLRCGIYFYLALSPILGQKGRMFNTIELPVWFVLIVAIFAVIAFSSHFLFPSVRWFFRRRAERVVARINDNLERPIEPFKLARRHDMIQQLLYHPDVMQAVNEHADEEDIPEDVAFEQAKKYAREIVPSFSASAYFTIATGVSRFLSQALYRVRMGHYDEALADIDSNATVVFVMNHRSNMDYVLVTYLASSRSALSYAVGEWARVWPLSGLIRAMGAYFIRRKSRGNLYRRVLARYVQMATEGGVTQAVFPEGGLSLDGRLADPKMGILNYVISSWDPAKRDVVFVPVALNYDRVLEDYILIAASKRGDRRFGANMSIVAKFLMNQLWLRITGRYNKFGYAAASFGRPLSLTEFNKKRGKMTTEKVASEVMRRIGEVVPVLPVPLVASVLVNSDPMPEDALKAAVISKMDAFDQGHVHVPREDADYAATVGIRNLMRRELIAETSDGIVVTEKGADVVPYYAATLEHLKLRKSKTT